MFRTSILASLILCFTSVAVFAEDARQLDVYRNDDRATRAFPIARDCDIDPRASAKGHVGPRPRPDERPFGERQQDPIEVQDERLRGRVFSLYRRPILHLQIWASDETDVPEA
jgi:hypothetical protein